MKCDKCGENEANIHMKNIFNGNITEYHICEECAKKAKESIEGQDFSFNSLMDGFLKENIEALESKKALSEKRCPKCSMSYLEFKKQGRFGCDNCYLTFRPEIKLLLQKINGTTKHIGKKPKRFQTQNFNAADENSNEIDSLKSEMEEAIKREDFELAADLRDRIKNLQDR